MDGDEDIIVDEVEWRHPFGSTTSAAPHAASVPDDLRPRRMFTAEQIRSSLPEPGGFGWRDLRLSR